MTKSITALLVTILVLGAIALAAGIGYKMGSPEPRQELTQEPRQELTQQELFEYVFPVDGARTARDVLYNKVQDGWVIKSVTGLGQTEGRLVALVLIERTLGGPNNNLRR